jgi:hypothetical protein
MNRRRIWLFVLFGLFFIGIAALYVPMSSRRKSAPIPNADTPTQSQPPEVRSAPPSPPEKLTPGRAMTRKIWEDTRFVFDGKAGEVVTLKVTSKTPGLDLHVELLNPVEDTEAFDDDSGGHGNSLIKDHALEMDGRYTAVVGVAESNEGKMEILLKKTGLKKARGSRPSSRRTRADGRRTSDLGPLQRKPL